MDINDNVIERLKATFYGDKIDKNNDCTPRRKLTKVIKIRQDEDDNLK